MEKADKENQSATWPMILAGLLVALIAYFIFSTIFLKSLERSTATQAINNSKDIYVSLRDHAIKHNEGLLLSSEPSSNEVFRKLIQTDDFIDEKSFLVEKSKHLHNPHKAPSIPDPSNLLEAGTNSFSYITLKDGKGFNVVSSFPNTPLLAAPMLDNAKPGFLDGVFHQCWNKQAVILRVDGSATAYRLDEDGKIIDYPFAVNSADTRFDPSDTKVTHPLGVRSK